KLFTLHKKDIVNPDDTGWDVTTIRTGEGREGTNYDFGVADGPCPLHEDPEQAMEWIMNQPDLPSRVAIPTDEEIHRLLKLPVSGGQVSQIDPGRQLEAGPAGETAGDILDAEIEGDDWD